MAILLSGCSSPKDDNMALAKEFYELNKNSSFGELSSLLIESRNTVYDSKNSKYQVMIYTVGVYDSLTRSYIKVPMFPVNAEKDDILKTYVDCDENCKELLRGKYSLVDDQGLLGIYEGYVKEVREMYNNIKLPKEYQYSNVLMVKGNPKLSRLSFKLTNEAEVFFVSKLDPVDTDFLKGVNKFDEHWYYKIGSNK
jgi:hypothetical protein